MAKHQRLHLGRPDLEARGIDHALEAVGHKVIAVLVDAAHVARAEVARALDLDKGLRIGLGAAPVALKNLRAAHHDLAGLAQRHIGQRVRVDHAGVHTHKRDAQALLLGRVRRVAVRGRGRLGQTVAFGVAQTVLL